METPAAVWTAPCTVVLCSLHFFSKQPWGLVLSKLQGNNLRLWLNVRISLDFDAIFSGKPLPFATNLSILCAVYHAQYSKYERHKRMVPSRRGHFIKVQFYWWQHWHGGHLRFFVIKYVAQIRRQTFENRIVHLLRWDESQLYKCTHEGGRLFLGFLNLRSTGS